MKLKQTVIATLLAAALAIPLAGCTGDNFAKVEQGRVIAYDEAKGEVTVIHDSAMDAQNPVYDVLPPVVFKLPTDKSETGPLPKAGQRLKLDVKKGAEEIYIFDAVAQKLAHIPLQNVDVQMPVEKNSPLVKDKEFPIIDKEKQTITIYSSRQKMLCTFGLPAEYADYPPSTWSAGDEVRFTYKEEGQMIRFMNISQTDIYKK